jgi:hypothetical protein
MFSELFFFVPNNLFNPLIVENLFKSLRVMSSPDDPDDPDDRLVPTIGLSLLWRELELEVELEKYCGFQRFFLTSK